MAVLDRARPQLINLRLLRAYQRSWLRGDVWAGLTVAAYLVPQVMAYAGLAGLSPIRGLLAAIPALALYAVLGSSRQLSVGPESTTALLSASIVAPLAAGDATRYAMLSAALALVFGLYCVLAWLIRLGFVADLLSRPVLVGYLAGLAVIMVTSQLGRLTGVHVSGSTFVGQLRSFAAGLEEFQPATFALAAASVVFLLLLQSRVRWAPGPLLAVLLATLATAAFDLERHGVAVVGPLTGATSLHPELPALSEVRQLLLPAFGLLVVGYTDVVLTARAFAARRGYDIDPNEELFALGACNIGAGLLHGFPLSSSASRTALGDAAGSRTQLHSLVAVAAVVLTLAFLRPVLAHFPTAALGALVVYAALRLVDLAELRRLARFRRSELLLAVSATVGVLALDIVYGVLLAVGLSVVEMLSRVARPHDAILGRVPGLPGMHDIDDYPEAEQIPGLIVYRYDSPLFFANAEDFKRRALAAVDKQDDVKWFVLNVEANVEVDITALDALESLRATLADRGIVVALARVKQDLLDDLEAYSLAKAIGREHLYPTLPAAVAAYEAWREANLPPAS
jgi:high affinity sulfate transporter 1